MGTTYAITYISEFASNHTKMGEVWLQQRIEDYFKQFNKRFSTYDAASEISRLNYFSDKQEVRGYKVSEEFFFLLDSILKFSKETDGAMDPTVGPLVDLWGFGRKQRERGKAPTSNAIAELQNKVGYEKVGLDIKKKQVAFLQGLQLDFSAVAKGYGVDGVARLLEDFGIVRYFVEVGGEIRVRGLSGRGEPWRIGVGDPNVFGSVKKVLFIKNGGVATSGDYLNYFEENGKRYSHLIDPFTGYPIEHKLVSVTVASSNTSRADALATAFMVMGEARGKEFALQRGLSVYFIWRVGENRFGTFATPMFKALLQ